MPRFTPWHAGLPPGSSDADTCLEAVIRPNLRRAFPLPDQEDPSSDLFRRLLAAFARPTGGSEWWLEGRMGTLNGAAGSQINGP